MKFVFSLMLLLISSVSFAEKVPTDSSIPEDEGIRCEVLLTGSHHNIAKGAIQLHHRLIGKTFDIYEVNGSIAMDKALGLGKLSPDNFEKLQAQIREISSTSADRKKGDYSISLTYKDKGKKKTAAELFFSAIPIHVWANIASTPERFDSYLKRNEAELHDIDIVELEDSPLTVPLGTKGLFEFYLMAIQFPEVNTSVFEIGVYLPCKSPYLRGVRESEMIRRTNGWKCTVPVLRFHHGLTPEVVAILEGQEAESGN